VPARESEAREQNVSEQHFNPVEMISGMIIRRRWWIILTATIVPLSVVGYVSSLPDGYTSIATLVVQSQQTAQRYIDPTMTTSANDIVRSMKVEILSAPRLYSIIEAFGLYPGLRGTATPDQLVERMRKEVEVEPLNQIPGRSDFTAFTVSFSASSPRLAQEVTSRLTALFIEVNLAERGTQASSATKFLSDQLLGARQRMEEQERKLTDFRQRNATDSPEQAQMQYAMLADLRIQLQSALAGLGRVQQQKVSLETSLNGIVARLQSDRTALLGRFTPKHPEIVKKDREIEQAMTLLGHLRAGTPTPHADSPDADDPLVAQFRAQVEANRVETATLTSDEQRLREEIRNSQGRLRLSPAREQQLAGLMRDYELYKQDYADLLNKQMRSQMAASLEEQQPGQNFKLIDPPTLPVVPSKPKRMKICLGGLGAGIALGLALAFLADLRVRTFHSEKEVKGYYEAPLVVGVPLMRTEEENRKRRIRWVLEGAACIAMLAVVAAAEYHVYQRSGSQLVESK
jgi:polysaccharide chain length determinant protein (PEP-CTERM system associated)